MPRIRPILLMTDPREQGKDIGPEQPELASFPVFRRSAQQQWVSSLRALQRRRNNNHGEISATRNPNHSVCQADTHVYSRRYGNVPLA